MSSTDSCTKFLRACGIGEESNWCAWFAGVEQSKMLMNLSKDKKGRNEADVDFLA
jgi:hypothetical protein